mmetsp:Transcript_11364/g.22759  ORF Transcript_11364/g.22759 Transcript_11364/m.22759 type:complete len:294 (-) Transcript_11364:29-910(-)
MSREPSLNAPVLPDQLNKLLALLLIRVIQPATSIDHVILLQHPQATSIGRRMREHEHLPPILRGMILHQLLEPIDLLLVDGDLVGRVHGIAEDRGAHAHQERLIGDLPAEIGGLLVVHPEVHFEVVPVGLELVQALEVVVPPHDVVGHSEGREELGGHLVAFRGAREELGGLLGPDGFGLAEVAEGDEGDVAVFAVGFFEDGEEVRAAHAVVFHFAGVHVQVAEDADDEFVGGAEGGGGAEFGGAARGEGAGEGGVEDPGDGHFEDSHGEVAWDYYFFTDYFCLFSNIPKWPK